jgi:hypothetical protein
MKCELKSKRNSLIVLAAIILALVPILSIGQPLYAPATETQKDIVDSAESIWQTIAKVMVFGGLVAAAAMFIWDKRYMWIFLGIVVIGAFGEMFAKWGLSLGGITFR